MNHHHLWPNIVAKKCRQTKLFKRLIWCGNSKVVVIAIKYYHERSPNNMTIHDISHFSPRTKFGLEFSPHKKGVNRVKAGFATKQCKLQQNRFSNKIAWIPPKKISRKNSVNYIIHFLWTSQINPHSEFLHIYKFSTSRIFPRLRIFHMKKIFLHGQCPRQISCMNMTMKYSKKVFGSVCSLLTIGYCHQILQLEMIIGYWCRVCLLTTPHWPTIFIIHIHLFSFSYFHFPIWHNLSKSVLVKNKRT